MYGVNTVKYLAEISAEIEGDENRYREVMKSALDGSEYALTDEQGVNNVKVRLVKATKIVEEELDLSEDEEAPQP